MLSWGWSNRHSLRRKELQKYLATVRRILPQFPINALGLHSPRLVYYRLYTKDGPITSNNPIYANDPFLSRTLTKFITPPHTALSVKGHICSIENLPRTTECSLFESLSGLTAIEDTAVAIDPRPFWSRTFWAWASHSCDWVAGRWKVSTKAGTQNVTRCCSARASLPYIGKSRVLWPNDAHGNTVYYRIYKEMEGVISSKTHFDSDDNTLGRIDMLSVAPPHTVASLKSQIIKTEGTIVNQNMQIFKDINGEELMNDKDHLSFQADTYPGCEEDDPIAVVCGEAKPQESQKKTTSFSQSIRVKGTWCMSLYFGCMPDRAILTWLERRRPSKVAYRIDWWCVENQWCQDIWNS